MFQVKPRCWLCLGLLLLCTLHAVPARALEAVPVPPDARLIELLPFTQIYRNVDDKLQVSTAPGPDGIVRRIEVRANRETSSNWAVFALANPGDEQIDRLLVAPHVRLVGSGVIRPDLGSVRVAAVTPSQGFPPQPVPSVDSDVFRITLDPGAVVTYVAELAAPTVPQLRLWQPEAYLESVNAYTLYKGIVIGIAGLLALFFLVVFLIKGTMMFAATAALAWAVFAHVLIDFEFLSGLFGTTAQEETVYRATTEVLLALTLAVFVFAYLRLNRWHISYTHAFAIIAVLFGALLGLAVAEPVTAAGIARLALPGVAGIGFLLIVYYALRGFDRAVMLIPTWILVIAWLVGAGLAVTGRIDNDIVQPALEGGLVLIVLSIGFTVMQHAFAGSVLMQGVIKDDAQSALALAGSGDIVWDWDVARDRITTGRGAEARLGLERGALQGPPQDWLAAIHPQDRDRFRESLDSLIEERRGRISDLFRFRGVDGHFRWLRLRARPVLGSDGEIIRCVGTLHDMTEAKTVEERLLHDSVHDNLTGLPNRHLLIDRIEMAMAWSNEATAQRLFVVVVNLDRFSDVNDEFGQSVGDSVLLTVARRLARVLQAHDSLARLGGDSFGMLVYLDPAQLDGLVDEIRQQVRTAIEFAEREIFVAASIGIAPVDLETGSAGELLENAELAMRRAKRQGGDRGEVFDPLMRRLNMSGRTLSRDLRKAIESAQVKLEFRPIVRLGDRQVAGLEAMVSWHHPLQGPLAWPALVGVAEREGLAGQLILSVLERSADLLVDWQKSAGDVFVLLPFPSGEPFRAELVADVKAVFARIRIRPGALQLGVAERVVADNPEFAVQLMRRLGEVGASLALDNFGGGCSWLGFLERLPLDAIRFDEGLTAMNDKGRRAKVLGPLVGLGHELGATLMASGVASDEEADAHHALGFDLATGAAFGRPLTAQTAGQLLRSYATAAE